MAVLTTTSVGPAGLLRNYWQDRLEGYLKNNLLASDLAEVQMIPNNSGNIIEFRRMTNFAKQIRGSSEFFGYGTFPLTNGASYSIDSVVYGVELLTNNLTLTKKNMITAIPNPVADLTDRFLYNAKDTLDQRMINKMTNNTGNTVSATAPSVTYFGTSVSVSVTWGDGSQTLTEATLDADNPSHRIAAESFNTAYTRLRSRSAPLRRGRYDALLAPEVCGDLRTDGTFQDIALKGTQRGEDKFEQAMVGDVFGIRVLEDENVGVGTAGTIDSTNDQIYRCPVVAPGYVARISYAGGLGSPVVNFIPPGKVDKADPFGLVGILTWQVWDAEGGIVNPLCGEILKVASTRTKNTSQTDDGVWLP